MTIQAIESAKLRLSEKMAAKITLFTGVSMRWLLANNYKLAPMCERDPEKPYTRETFQMTRAEVFDPRIHPLDVRAIQNLLAVAYHRVCDAAIQAYRAKEVTYFNYALHGAPARLL